MPETSIDSTFLWLFSLHCLNGAIGAAIAQSKGYPLGKWLLWGLLGGTATLVAALFNKRVS